MVDFKNWQMERKKFAQFQNRQQIDNSTPGDFLARLARLCNDDPETFNKVKRLVYAMLEESDRQGWRVFKRLKIESNRMCVSL